MRNHRRNKFAALGRVISIQAMVLFGALALASSSALAQEQGEAGVIYKKKTVVSFSDDTIDGDLMKPDGAYVQSRKRVRHSNLIKIRDNFRMKILTSVSKL